MSTPIISSTILVLVSMAMASNASGHVSYTNRNFGTFSGGAAQVVISNQTVSGNYGWADGTDDNFGDSHRLRAYRFELTYETDVTITATATTNNGALLGDLLPGFSIYQGLAHMSPDPADYDYAAISAAYTASLPGVAKEGAFVALGNWKMGNDAGLTFADLSSFAYMGHAVDGTSANYGLASGIIGDGLADGSVTGTFHLLPGSYSIFVGGADYSAESNGTTNRGVNVTFSIVPEPSAVGLAVIGLLGLIKRRRH